MDVASHLAQPVDGLRNPDSPKNTEFRRGHDGIQTDDEWHHNCIYKVVNLNQEATMNPLKDQHPAKPAKVLSKEFIPLYGGRPSREKIINREDALDLKILLNSTEDVDAFLAKL